MTIVTAIEGTPGARRKESGVGFVNGPEGLRGYRHLQAVLGPPGRRADAVHHALFVEQ